MELVDTSEEECTKIEDDCKPAAKKTACPDPPVLPTTKKQHQDSTATKAEQVSNKKKTAADHCPIKLLPPAKKKEKTNKYVEQCNYCHYPIAQCHDTLYGKLCVTQCTKYFKQENTCASLARMESIFIDTYALVINEELLKEKKQEQTNTSPLILLHACSRVATL